MYGVPFGHIGTAIGIGFVIVCVVSVIHAWRSMKLLIVIAAAVASTLALAAPAHADPGPICGAPGAPPCAGPNLLTPQQQCALIAWRTMLPCNWLGMQVPQNTPGSWG